MRTANIFGKMVLVAVIVLFAASTVWPATVGKIRGRVIDEKTKEPIPAVAVRVEGTSMGALTDPKGEYIIINVPPGAYSLAASSVAYNTKITHDVRVTVDHTTVVDFALEERITELDIVQEVVAERDLLRISETQNIHQITAENIKTMPVTTVEEILTAQVGVVERFGELHVRGGRANEVTYVVDGVEVKDPLGGYGAVEQAMSVSGNVVADLQIIKGGFDPEYGNATSGIVTIATKSGGDVTRGHVEYFTDDLGTEILNKNSFNYDRMEFNLSGPEPVFADRLFPALGIDWFKDRLKYSLSGSFDKNDEYVNYKEYSTPAAQRQYPTRKLLGLFEMRDRSTNEYEAQAKLNWQATPQVNLIMNYRGTWKDRVPFDWSFRYTPGSARWVHEESNFYSMTLKHQLDKSTVYQLILSRFKVEYLDTPSDPDVPGGRKLPGDFMLYTDWEYFQDKDGDGVFDEPEPFINVNGDTSWYWGGPFYTVGDAYLYAGGSGIPLWPTVAQEAGTPNWRTEGFSYSDWRGVDVNMNGRTNSEAGFCDTILTDWNGNGRIDFYESEPFQDVNGDGRWNANDYFLSFYDANGNGRYDPSHASPINVDQQEPYVDGDQVLGEPFTDVNLNGYYEEGIDVFLSSPDPVLNQDLNYSSEYEGPGTEWSPGMPFADLNGNGVYDAPNGIYDYGEPFLDLNQNGKWDPQDGFFDRGYDRWAHYSDMNSIIWSADFTINKQIGREHDVKSGVELNFYDLSMGDLQYPWQPYDGVPDGGPWPEIGVFRDFYNRKPILGSFFVGDRMEYGAMIANLGLRYDFFIQSAELKTQESEGFGEEKSIEGSKNKFSPRIGFSYPISDKAKVFFNYGHFYQLPELSRMYQRATQASNAAGIIGNENLDYKKTIQYEFGVTYKLSMDYVLDLSGFYKDEFGKINTVNRSYGPIQRSEFENLDYGRTRGLEMELNKKYGNYVSGYVTYSYMFAYGKSSNQRSNYYDDFYGREIPISEYPLDWDQRHMITLNLNLTVPPGDHPYLFGLKLPDNWGFNALWQFGTGFPYTPDRDYPGIRLALGETPQANSLRYPATSNVDLRAWKRFPFLGVDLTLDLWVSNLFDNENIRRIYGTTGRHDTNSKPVGANYVFEGDDIAKNPANLDEGRNIRLGIGVDF